MATSVRSSLAFSALPSKSPPASTPTFRSTTSDRRPARLAMSKLRSHSHALALTLSGSDFQPPPLPHLPGRDEEPFGVLGLLHLEAPELLEVPVVHLRIQQREALPPQVLHQMH